MEKNKKVVVSATTTSPSKLYPNQIPVKIPEKIIFKVNWNNRHTRRAQFEGASAPSYASSAKKNPNQAKAKESAAMNYMIENVSCKIWEIPVRPKTSSQHRAFIRRLIAAGEITRDPFNPTVIHVIEK